MGKNNDTFGIEDEWYLKFGPQVTKEDATLVTQFEWRVIKRGIQKLRAKYETAEGWDKRDAHYDYKGTLWHYKEVVLRFKIQPGQAAKPTPVKIKQPK